MDIPAQLASQYLAVRRRSEQLCAPLAVDDYQVQAEIEASPPKWHLAHVSWFFETFLLHPFHPGYAAFHPSFGYLFNSYYEQVGSFHPRDRRHVLSRPTVEEVYRYRAHVDEHVLALIGQCPEDIRPELSRRLILGLHHEQQHQELLLMDIKRNFDANPLLPAYTTPAALAGTESSAPFRWLDFPGGLHEIGHQGDGFCFDNETPRHKVYLEDYRLGSRLTTNGEYLEFIDAGGYGDARWWLSDGWRTIQKHDWNGPLYWKKIDGAWHEMTLGGCRPLRLAEPVCHVSYYEADAFARWRGARLPLEAEFEVATAALPVEGNFAESGLFHPQATSSEDEPQWFGDLWEWTQSPYTPYPRFRPLEGALGEYNGKFMANQFVLRGGCCVTPASHMRPTYRNFFYPHERWPFTGIRLATDAY